MVSVSRTRVPQGWRTDMSHLDAIEAPALAADTSRTVIWCNSPAEHVLGRPCEQLCGADLVELLADPYHHGPLGEVVGQVLGGSTWAGELPVVVAGGTERRAGLTVTPLRRDADVVGLLLLLEPGSHGRPLESATRAMHDRLTRIARVTAELASVGDMDTLTRTVITRAADAAGATVASLMTLVDEDTFALTGLRGGGEGAASRWATFPLSAHTPAGDSVRSGRPVVLSGRDAIQAAYPDLESAAPGERSLVSLPLAVAGHP
ncbi:MAG TPA: PAS domain-containing protein, partial [Nocardioidaceae bacterium]|nr:PAS domain-containing protein [Nocardioidaceae bacterium]